MSWPCWHWNSGSFSKLDSVDLAVFSAQANVVIGWTVESQVLIDCCFQVMHLCDGFMINFAFVGRNYFLYLLKDFFLEILRAYFYWLQIKINNPSPSLSLTVVKMFHTTSTKHLPSGNPGFLLVGNPAWKFLSKYQALFIMQLACNFLIRMYSYTYPYMIALLRNYLFIFAIYLNAIS